MIIDIPGRKPLNITRLVFDYNGTLACDGKLSGSVKETIVKLSEIFEIYVLTADTYGCAREQLEGLPVVLETFPTGEAGAFKEKIVNTLGSYTCASIGNGFNDIKMLKIAAFSVGVIGREGICAELISCADIIVNSIEDGLNLFLDARRIVAGLRH